MKALYLSLRNSFLAIAFTLLMHQTAWSDVVAYYDFDGDALDSSSMSNHGTLMGDATFSISTPDAIGGGQSLLLDGNSDYVVVNADSSLDSSVFSVSFWINSAAQNGQFERILSRTSDTFELAASNSGLLSYHTSANGWTSTGHSLALNDWSHIAFTYDGSTLLGYADGSQFFSGNPSINPSGNLYIGGRWVGPGTEGFQGLIDDLALFDEVLTVSEISSLANGSSTPLTLNAVPEPGSAFLLSIAGLFIANQRRRTHPSR